MTETNRARVYFTNGLGQINRVKQVKNLGWALANAKHADTVAVSKLADNKACFSIDGRRNGWEFTYIVDFESYNIAVNFAKRRIFAHCNLNILN